MPSISRLPGARTVVSRILRLSCICLFLATSASCLNPKADPVVAVPPPPPPTFQAAVNAYYDGKSGRSLFMLEGLLTKHPTATRPRWELVHQFEEVGNYASAIRELKSLYGLSKDTAKIEEALFSARVLGGRLDAARSMLPLARTSYRSLFFEALLRMDLGEKSRAERLFSKSLGLHENQPMAWYFLGRLAFDARDYQTARADFQEGRALNPDLTIAIPPLARALLADGDYARAYPLLLRARNILPNSKRIRSDIAEVEKRQPQLVRERERASSYQQRTTFPPRVTTFPERSALTPLIRVGLAEHLESLTIKTGGAFRVRSLAPSGSVAYHGTGGELLKLTSTGSEVRMSIEGGPTFLTWTAPVVLTYAKKGDTTEIFDLVTGKGSFYATSGDRAYRGAMIFRPTAKGFTVVNRLPLEEYLYSVLPSEMFSFWPMAALKAQAVAARSYTLASMGAFESKGFDVYGSVLSAAYTGVGNESPSTTKAVNATQGEILVLHGKPLKAYYNANSGGYTENTTVVWGGRPQGMKAVPDPRVKKRSHFISLTALTAWLRSDPASYSSVPPFFSPSSYRWVKWVPAREIEREIAKVKKIGRVLAIIPRGRGISGRVDRVEVMGTMANVTLTGDNIRALLGNLRSTLFTLRPKFGSDGFPQYFIFTGGGWGHGVGMDQDGAAGMASAGYSYKQILSHYYPLAHLQRISAIKGRLPLLTHQRRSAGASQAGKGKAGATSSTKPAATSPDPATPSKKPAAPPPAGKRE